MNNIITLRLSEEEKSNLDETASQFDFATWFFGTLLWQALLAAFGVSGPTALLTAGVTSSIGLITLKAIQGDSSFAQTLSGMDAKQIQASFEKGLLFMSGSLIIIIYLTDNK